VRRVVLEHDQHPRRQRDDPQQHTAKLRAAGDVRGPVARIDEAHRDQHSRPDVAEDVERRQRGRVRRFVEFGEQAFHGRGSGRADPAEINALFATKHAR
jgi:hypothetical protein